MPRGGARPGAGRPKGGTKQRETRLKQEVALALSDEGLSPLAFMLKLMRDKTVDNAVRFEAAKAAAPFVHPRLSAVTQHLKAEIEQKQDDEELINDLERRLARRAAVLGAAGDPQAIN